MVRYRYRYRKNPATIASTALGALGGAAGGGICHGLYRGLVAWDPEFLDPESRMGAGAVGLLGVVIGAIAARVAPSGGAEDVARGIAPGAAGWAVCKAFSCEAAAAAVPPAGAIPPQPGAVPAPGAAGPGFPVPAAIPAGRLTTAYGRPVPVNRLTGPTGRPVGAIFNAQGQRVPRPSWVQEM